MPTKSLTRRARQVLLIAVLAAGCRATAPAQPETAPEVVEASPQLSDEPMPEKTYEEAIAAIAQDIAALADDHPQLAEFDPKSTVDLERLVISYGYHTHRSEHRGGWVSGVPNPDPDGIWFHIDFHDPKSMAQIHTQPVVQPLAFRDKRVMFLILEGEETTPVGAEIQASMLRHGVTQGAAQ